jgi:hypothetical protein
LVWIRNDCIGYDLIPFSYPIILSVDRQSSIFETEITRTNQYLYKRCCTIPTCGLADDGGRVSKQRGLVGSQFIDGHHGLGVPEYILITVQWDASRDIVGGQDGAPD